LPALSAGRKDESKIPLTVELTQGIASERVSW
jgi:hypothetical protein